MQMRRAKQFAQRCKPFETLKSNLQMVAACKKSVQSTLHTAATGFQACKALCALLQRILMHAKHFASILFDLSGKSGPIV
jgi:hypothetical protein